MDDDDEFYRINDQADVFILAIAIVGIIVLLFT
jgi:hypothetical protein